MKKNLTICLFGFTPNTLAFDLFKHIVNATKHIKGLINIEINELAYCVNKQTVIHCDTDVTKTITVGTAVTYGFDNSFNKDPFFTIKTIMAFRKLMNKQGN